MAKSRQPLDVYATEQASLDFQYWQSSGNHKKLDRINKLIESACINPSQGIGKPERLKFFQSETYSRRIDNTHRLVYRVEDESIVILTARFHYGDK